MSARLFAYGFLALFVLGFGGGCPSYGGDGGGGDEYYGDDDDSVGGCDYSFECDDLEFCNAGECDAGLDRRYRVNIYGGEAQTTGPDGSWDMGGGAPDLYVRYGMMNSAADAWTDSCDTTVAQDSFSPNWNGYCEFVFVSGGTFGIYAWDDDLTSPDFAGGVYWQGSDALMSVIRLDGQVSETDVGDYLSISWLIEPTF